MEPKKKTLQCPICQATYSRKDNLLRHLKKFHSENIATRIPTKKVKKSEPCLSESITFITPFTMIVSGVTMSGKTEWVKRLLAHKENMMIPVPKKVLFCCKYWQPSYTEMLQTVPEITFCQGMPNGLVHFDPNVPSLIVFGDLMRTLMDDDMATDLFTEGAHHHNISVVFIIQNLVFQGK